MLSLLANVMGTMGRTVGQGLVTASATLGTTSCDTTRTTTIDNPIWTNSLTNSISSDPATSSDIVLTSDRGMYVSIQHTFSSGTIFDILDQAARNDTGHIDFPEFSNDFLPISAW
jgi:hypothetical protein